MRFGKVQIPVDLSYTRDHLWVRRGQGLFTLGWTDYIQQNAGDVNYIELPEQGVLLEVGEDFGSIETSKWVDRLYSPLCGKVVEVNDRVIERPQLINVAPFAEGWFVRMASKAGEESTNLMSPAEYVAFLRTCEKEAAGS